jgi:putative restriction endonuclease
VSSTDVQRVLERMSALRQHQQDGRRSPHKPLLVLLALGRLAETGSSSLPWSVAEERLADLLEEFGPTSKTPRAQSAAYPFTRLRSDGVWTLDHDVPMDRVSPLREGGTGCRC